MTTKTMKMMIMPEGGRGGRDDRDVRRRRRGGDEPASTSPLASASASASGGHICEEHGDSWRPSGHCHARLRITYNAHEGRNGPRPFFSARGVGVRANDVRTIGNDRELLIELARCAGGGVGGAGGGDG